MPASSPASISVPRTAAIALLLALLAVLTACSGGATTISAATTTTLAPTTTVAPTTTTTLAPTTTVAPTTTLPPMYAQLTGRVISEAITRPAAVVKIDNHPFASPQWGLNQADVVFEELVEGTITRFAAIFHSTDVVQVGPIRSARTGDFDLLRNLNKPLFVNSGANETVWQLLRREDAIVVSDANLGKAVFSRSSEKRVPHNMITSTALIYAARPDEGGTPPPLFAYRDPSDPLAASVPAAGVDIDFGATEVSYRWVPSLGAYARSQYDTPHIDSNGVRIAPDNVIVQFVTYGQSAASSITPEPRLIGKGEALVFSGGRVTPANWHRASSSAVTQFRYPNDTEVELTPGSTWVALARTGTATVVH